MSFNASVIAESQIENYRWDYNGNGTWDYVSSRSANATHVYSAPGIYDAICSVTDALGRSAQDTVSITVYDGIQPPFVQASAAPLSGTAPLAVTLGSQTEGPDSLQYYLWDFTGNGIIDWGSQTTSVATHNYGQSGEYSATLTVIGVNGLTACDTVYIQVAAPAVPPQAEASSAPVMGEVPLTVNFSGTGTPTEEIVLYEWDFNGDGTFDWASQTDGTNSYVYTLPGEYAPVFRVTTAAGLTATDTTQVSITTASRLRAWISVPRENSTVSGDVVTVRTNTAPGSLTGWVQPQFKAAMDSGWTDIGSPIFPPANSFDCLRDTSGLDPGSYNLRARAADTEENIVYSPIITVTVASPKLAGLGGIEIEEYIDEQGNHVKRQTVFSSENNMEELAGGMTLSIPYGTASQDARAILTAFASNPHPLLSDIELFYFASFELEGISSLLKPATLVIPYEDANSDGVVDGWGISESALVAFWYNQAAGEWQMLPDEVIYTEENLVQTKAMLPGDYALGVENDLGSPTPVGVSTATPPPSPPAGPTATPSPTWTIIPPATRTPVPKTPPPTPIPTATAVGYKTPLPWIYDYDGDGTSDIGIFRPSSGLWAIRGVTRAYWGKSGDEPVPGDYDGDGTTNIGAYRPAAGYWFIKDLTRVFWGKPGDIPIPFLYPNPSSALQAHIGVYRPSSGLWAIRGVTRAYWGKSSDEPIPGHYLGDGTACIGAFRPSTGYWFIKNVTKVFWGRSGDVPVTR